MHVFGLLHSVGELCTVKYGSDGDRKEHLQITAQVKTIDGMVNILATYEHASKLQELAQKSRSELFAFADIWFDKEGTARTQRM